MTNRRLLALPHAGPFGAAEDVSVLSPEASTVEGPLGRVMLLLLGCRTALG